MNIGATFVFTILTFYTFCYFLLQQKPLYEQLTLVHFNYQVFYLIYTYMVIYSGSMIAREVNINIAYSIVVVDNTMHTKEIMNYNQCIRLFH